MFHIFKRLYLFASRKHGRDPARCCWCRVPVPAWPSAGSFWLLWSSFSIFIRIFFFIKFSTIFAVFVSGLLVVRDFLPYCVSYIRFIQHRPNCRFSLGILQRPELITTPHEFLWLIYVYLHFYIADRESVPGLPFHLSVWSGPPSWQVSSVVRRWFFFKLFRFQYLYQSKV